MAATQTALMREITLFGVCWAVDVALTFELPLTMRRALICMNRAIIAHQWRVAAPPLTVIQEANKQRLRELQ